MIVTMMVTGCSSSSPERKSDLQDISKIKFSLDNIHPDGLRGPPDGLVSVAYEFCIPADEKIYQEVRRIDPSVKIHHGSRGRVGCSKDQALCVGETHQSRWREVLKELSSLKYVAEIRECFFE
jgi:hypothetical protein